MPSPAHRLFSCCFTHCSWCTAGLYFSGMATQTRAASGIKAGADSCWSRQTRPPASDCLKQGKYAGSAVLQVRGRKDTLSALLQLPFSCSRSFGFPGGSWTTQGCSHTLEHRGGWTSAGKYRRVGRRDSNNRGETVNAQVIGCKEQASSTNVHDVDEILHPGGEENCTCSHFCMPTSLKFMHLVTLTIFKNKFTCFFHLPYKKAFCTSPRPLQMSSDVSVVECKCPLTCQWWSAWSLYGMA